MRRLGIGILGIQILILMACLPTASSEVGKPSPPEGYRVISGQWKHVWQGVPVEVGALPSGSWYIVAKDQPQELEIKIHPNVGEHYLLQSHDFEVFVRIERRIEGAVKNPKRIACVRPKGFDDLRDQSFERDSLKITVGSDVHYTYHGEFGSNPNPYTPEVVKILKRVIENIRIGHCGPSQVILTGKVSSLASQHASMKPGKPGKPGNLIDQPTVKWFEEEFDLDDGNHIVIHTNKKITCPGRVRLKGVWFEFAVEPVRRDGEIVTKTTETYTERQFDVSEWRCL